MHHEYDLTWKDISYCKYGRKYCSFLKEIWQQAKGRVKKKLVEFSIKAGGWGQQWTDFPLIFFFEKKY